MKNQNDFGYNDRLFSGGLRGRLHYARYHWFRDTTTRLNIPVDAVLELGCFDGKLIPFMPARPGRYVGFDSNWEGGLDAAKAKWGKEPNFAFNEITSPEQMLLGAEDMFTLAVAMETLEHVPPPMVDGYLRKIAQHLNGYFIVTGPNEKGILFLAKWLTKRMTSRDAEPYTYSELINATLGRLDRVARREHKGFDYSALIKQIEKHFDVLEVSALPFKFLPLIMSFTVTIVAKSKAPNS